MSKKILLIIVSSALIICQLPAQQNLKLWYKKPARVWTEALPVGNGRLGANGIWKSK